MTCDIAASEASNQKARNISSHQLIKATSCIEILDTTIGAEYLSSFSSYQTLTMEKL
jgi:hypothetical protein